MSPRTFRVSLLLALTLTLSLASSAQTGTATDDDLFIDSLSEGPPDEPVDRARLAKLFANVAKMLQVETSKIENLQYLVRVPEAIRENASLVMESRYEEYAAAVGRFDQSAVGLEAQPQSRLRLYRTLMDGQRTCWMLDLYHQLVGSWSGGGAELRSILPSRVACGRFRTAAFRPRVEAILGDALVEQVYQRDEIESLRGDLSDLQDLLDDLMQIEAEDAGEEAP